MKRLAFLFLALICASAASGQGKAGSHGKCVAGPSEPSVPPLPPHSIAICHYPSTEFHARVDRLLAIPAGTLGNQAIERIFSSPPLTISHDDPRSTNLSISLFSAPGKPWWAAVSYLQEGFFGPRFEGPPVPLRGAPRRPVPFLPGKRGDISVSVQQLSLLEPRVPGPAPCLTAGALLESARRHGWIRSPIPYYVSPHAPPGWHGVALTRDGLSFSTEFRDEKDCVLAFTLSQPGNPPPRK